jgi:arginine decarboxylase
VTSPDHQAGDRHMPALADDLRTYYRDERSSFHMPGHKQRVGALHPMAAALLGEAAIRADVSEMGGFDYLHAPTGAMAAAQARAAETFGADRTFFLVNGSTGGNLSAICAFAGDGDEMLMLRGSHRSVYTAAALSGALPRYVPMLHDVRRDGWFVAAAPAHDGDLAVIHVTRPNYYGMACDLAPYVELAHRTGAVLVVDEAHGSHFGLHPELPRSALQEGADVVIQSTHKTLGALTQASMLHVRGTRADPDRLARSLQMLQSSSPSALLSISLDLAATQVGHNGRALMDSTLSLARSIRRGVAALPGLLLLGSEVCDGTITSLDPTKLVIDVSGLGCNGFRAARFLKERERINVELADHRRIVCSVTIGDTEESATTLVQALTALAASAPDASRSGSVPLPSIPELVETPRRALQRPTTSVPMHAAADRTCAEYMIPYPPGVPIVVPGERLTSDVLASIRGFRDAGSRIVGPVDATGEHVLVLA